MMRLLVRSIYAVVLSGAGLPSAPCAHAATLVAQALDLPPVQYGAQAWAIPDTSSAASGKSILAVTGLTSSGEIKTHIIWIAPAAITGQPSIVKVDDSSIPGVVFGQVDWADYNRDGLLDLAIAGRTENAADTLANDLTMVYRQLSDGTFVQEDNFPTGFGVDSCTVRWVDYDVDGYPDLFVSGRQRSPGIDNGKRVVLAKSRLYMFRNTTPDGSSHLFSTSIPVESRIADMVPLHGGDADWADIDGNGTPDLAITGVSLSRLQGQQTLLDTLTDVYINDPPGVFTRNLTTTIPAQYGGGVAWGDLNRDGKLDLAVSGFLKGVAGAKAPSIEVYENLGEGYFKRELININQQHAVAGRLVWADADNDGWPDLIAMGDAGTVGLDGVSYFRNNQDDTFGPDRMTFTPATPSLAEGCFAVGHLNGNVDGTLDLIASGRDESTGQTTISAWTVGGVPPNTAPTVPTLNRPLVAGNKVIFSWSKAEDAAGDRLLSYELLMYSGTGSDVLKVFSSRAAFSRGPNGTQLTFTLHRSLAPNPGMPLFVRALDLSSYSSDWSQQVTVRVQDFVNSLEVLTPLRSSAATWVDVDNDGEADLMANGFDQGNNETIRLYLTKNGKLTPVSASIFALPGFYLGSQAWGDVNGDGYVDVLITGQESEQVRLSTLYLNRSAEAPGRFEEAITLTPPLTGSRAAMGDIDGDGDVDIIITGIAGTDFKTILGINTTPRGSETVTFDGIDLNLPLQSGTAGLKDGWISLYDYDQDGDLDITIQGTIDVGNNGNADDDFMGGFIEMFRNEGNLQFTPHHFWPEGDPVVAQIAPGESKLDQLGTGEHVWADIDNDGDPDFIAVGFSRVCSEFVGPQGAMGFDASALRIYENTGGGNLVMKQAFPGMWNATLAVADVTNDGKVDILVSGNDDHHYEKGPDVHLLAGDPTLRLYENDGTGSFAVRPIVLFDNYATANANAPFYVGAGIGAVRLYDVDGDGDLDMSLVGETVTPGGTIVPLSTLYSNTNANSGFFVNRASFAPTGLRPDTTTTDSVTLSWNEATDPDGLVQRHTYSVRIGTMSGRGDVKSGLEPIGPGRLGFVHQTRVKDLPDGVYHWSVRAVDNGFARSDWATESLFTIDTTPPFVAGIRGDSLSVGSDRRISVAIDFDDLLTGVDTTSQDITVTLSIVGRPTVEVRQLPWGPGDVWFGEALVDVGSFLSEPVTIRIKNVRDNRGNVMTDATITMRLKFPGVTITKDQGGTITNSTGTVSLYLPPNAVPRDVELSLNEHDPASLATVPGTAVGNAVEFVPDTVTLQRPAILTLKYAAAAAKLAKPVAEADLHIFRLEGGGWKYVGGLADVKRDSISAPIDTLGTYALFEATGPVGVETLSDLDITPRIFSPDVTGGFSDHAVIGFTVAASEQGANASVKVYNTAGRLIWDETPPVTLGANSVRWDGSDEDGNRVRSALYIVAVRVGGIQKTKTVVVVNKYAQ